MKKTLLFSIFMGIILFGMAQTVVFSDNFDSYTVGSYLAQSNSAWTTWFNQPGSNEDGIITDAQAASVPNSLLVSGNTDQVYPFGNYTTGHYTVTFNMYIPSSGNGAYFNIQHVMLQQYCFECYFYNNGSGYLMVGGSNHTFTYPSNSWFPVVMDVDMDQDEASLSINNVVVHTWPFHYTVDATTGGANQLAGIDLYAGAPNNASGTYYVDDFTVTEVSAAQIGQFVVNPETLSANLEPETSATLNLNFNNPGTGSTDYKIITTYDIPNPDTTSTGMIGLSWWHQSVNAYGFNNASQYDLAAGFPSELMQDHIGKTLRIITIPLNDSINGAKIRVYAMGKQFPMDGPGEMIYEQSFTPVQGWNHVDLNEPVVIDGGDLWIGVWIDQPAAAFPFYADSVLSNNYSSWFKNSSSSTWQPSNGMKDLLIEGWIDGTPITPWLSVNPEEGSIAASGNQTIAVTVNSNGMNNDETRTAKLNCYSNSFDNPKVVVPVSLSTTEVSVNEHNQIVVTLYPNPATEYLNLSADLIQRVEIYNMAGQKVLDNTCNDSHVVISTGNLTAGTYMVTVTTNSGNTTKKVIIR